MCWNKEVSFLTGFFSTAIAAYLYKRDHYLDKWFAIFLFSVAPMQWIEFALWIQIDYYPDHEYVNEFITLYMIPTLLALQPLASYYGLYLTKHKYASQLFPIYIAFSLVFAAVLFTVPKRKTTAVCKKKDLFGKSLDWGMRFDSYGELIKTIFYIAQFIFLFLPYALFLRKSFALQLTGFAMLLIMYFTLYLNDSGSRWCLYTNIAAVIFLLTN